MINLKHIFVNIITIQNGQITIDALHKKDLETMHSFTRSYTCFDIFEVTLKTL